jgi:hypothetical protein
VRYLRRRLGRAIKIGLGITVAGVVVGGYLMSRPPKQS